jgi:hypothetical protein
MRTGRIGELRRDPNRHREVHQFPVHDFEVQPAAANWVGIDHAVVPPHVSVDEAVGLPFTAELLETLSELGKLPQRALQL